MGSFDFGPWIIAAEVVLLLALVGLVVFIYRNRQFLKRSNGMTEILTPGQDLSIQDLVDRARQENPDIPVNIMLGSGSYSMKDELRIDTSVRLFGKSVEETKIVAEGGHPAISIQDAKDCSLSNVRVEGAIQCKNGEVHLKNCHIVAKDDGICIEAYDGSIVTFSGLIRGEGGIAIRAKGESKVILKPPYALSGDDFIVVDPKSKVDIEDGARQIKDNREEA